MKQFASIAAFVMLGLAQAAKFPIVHNELSHKSIAYQLDHLSNSFLKGEQIKFENHMDWSYLVEVEVGTPPKKFMLAPDTITSDSWIMSKKCWSLPCFWQATYDASKSSTYVADGQQFNQTVNDMVFGRATGNMSMDTFKLGDLVASNFKFGEIKTVYGNDWVFKKASGVLGLGYNTSGQSISGMAPFLHQASPDAKTFSLYLNKAPKESYMTVPGMDTDNYEIIKEHKIVNKDLFQLKLGSIKQGKVTVQNEDYTVGFAMAYEGIVAGNGMLDTLLDEVIVYKDCSNIDALPDFTFEIDGIDYTMTPQDYVIKDYTGECMNGIAPVDLYRKVHFPANTVILGNIFMKKFYPYFNMDDDIVAFQRAKQVEEQIIQ